VDFLSIELLLLLDSTLSCLLIALPSILPPFTTLLTTQIVPTPWFSCFHKEANLYFLFLGLTTTLSNFLFFSIPNLQDQALLPSTSIPLHPLNGATPIALHWVAAIFHKHCLLLPLPSFAWGATFLRNSPPRDVAAAPLAPSCLFMIYLIPLTTQHHHQSSYFLTPSHTIHHSKKWKNSQ
jgi:hypothetical protein